MATQATPQTPAQAQLPIDPAGGPPVEHGGGGTPPAPQAPPTGEAPPEEPPAGEAPEGEGGAPPEGEEPPKEPEESEADRRKRMQDDPLFKKMVADAATRAAKKAAEDAIAAERERVEAEAARAKMTEIERATAERDEASAKLASAEAERDAARADLEFYQSLQLSGKQLVEDEDAPDFLKQKALKKVAEGMDMASAVSAALAESAYLVRQPEPAQTPATSTATRQTPAAPATQKPKITTQTPAAPAPKKKVDVMNMTPQEWEAEKRRRGIL